MAALLEPEVDLWVRCLNDAMEGWGTDENSLTALVCTIPERLRIPIFKKYYEKTGKGLLEHIESDTSFSYKKARKLPNISKLFSVASAPLLKSLVAQCHTKDTVSEQAWDQGLLGSVRLKRVLHETWAPLLFLMEVSHETLSTRALIRSCVLACMMLCSFLDIFVAGARETSHRTFRALGHWQAQGIRHTLQNVELLVFLKARCKNICTKSSDPKKVTLTSQVQHFVLLKGLLKTSKSAFCEVVVCGSRMLTSFCLCAVSYSDHLFVAGANILLKTKSQNRVPH